MKQTWGIALVSILIWIGAGIALLGGAFAFLMGGTLTSLGMNIGIADFSAYLISAAWISIIFAILYAILGVFLWYHNTWAWCITFVLIILGLISILPGILVFSWILILSIILPILEIVALTTKESMAACKVKVFDWKGWG